MKFATVTLSTLLAVLTVESAAVRAETIFQPFAKGTPILAQQPRGIRSRNNFSQQRL